LLLIITVGLPIITVPWFLGGAWKGPPYGI